MTNTFEKKQQIKIKPSLFLLSEKEVVSLFSNENSTQKLLTKYSTEEKNKHVICRPRSVRIGKNCAGGLEYKLQRNVVMCLTRPKLENKEKEEQIGRAHV